MMLLSNTRVSGSQGPSLALTVWAQRLVVPEALSKNPVINRTKWPRSVAQDPRPA